MGTDLVERVQTAAVWQVKVEQDRRVAGSIQLLQTGLEQVNPGNIKLAGRRFQMNLGLQPARIRGIIFDQEEGD